MSTTEILIEANRRDNRQRREIKQLSEVLFLLIGEIGQHLRTEGRNRRPNADIPEWLADNHPELVDALEIACDTLGEDPEWWTTHILDSTTDI
jgi:hypothetical protein